MWQREEEVPTESAEEPATAEGVRARAEPVVRSQLGCGAGTG